MTTQAGSAATDREARNDYLCEIDQTWEEFRDTVEGVRSSFEEAFESCGTTFETERADAAAAHVKGLDQVWATYRQQIGDTGTRNRREVITEARSDYRDSAAEMRKKYDERVATARESYSKGLHEARARYEAAVDGALAAYRKAVENVQHFTDPPAHDDLNSLEFAGAMAARSSKGGGRKDASLESIADDAILIETALSSLNGSNA